MSDHPLRPTHFRLLLPLLPLLALLLLQGCAGGPEVKQDEEIPFPAPPDTTRFFYERTIRGTGDVAIVSEEEQFKNMLTGASSYKGNYFTKPYDVAVRQGRVYVSDSRAAVVHAMDYVTGETFTIGREGGQGLLERPIGLAISPITGELFVSDTSIDAVYVYDRDGNYLRVIGDRTTIARPVGLDVSPDGAKLYVTDLAGIRSQDHRIQVFDTTSGKLLQTIGKRGKGDGELNLPRDVKVGPDGMIYVVDGGNFRIQVFNPEGEYVRQWGEPSAQFGDFSRPKGIAIDKDGNVYVVDTAFGNFQIFTNEGELLLFVGSRSTQWAPAKYMLPAGIDIDEDGRIYLVDQYFAKIDVFRPAALAREEGFLSTKERANKKP